MKKKKGFGEEFDEIQIEEILAEAAAYGLRAEVIISANGFIKDDEHLDKVVAYEMAYIELIRNFTS